MALRESLVAPSVEDNLLKLNELVKNMGNKGNDLTESQTRRMVAYLGNMDEMRHQLVVMIQRYEDDERVLRRLLDLVDRIDEMKMIVDHHNAASFEPDGADIVDNIDEELAKQLFDQPFNPLMVSAKEVSILAVSGLADDGAYAASLAYQDEEADDEGNPWDQVDDPDQLQASIEFEDPNLEVEALQIQLSASSISLPSIIPLRDSLQLPPPPPPPMPAKAFKPRLQQTSSSSSGSGSSSSVRRGPRRAHSELTLSLSSDESDTGSSSEGETAARRWNRGMRPNARQPIVQPPPPPPPAPASKGKRRVYGACAAVACKICFEEYTKHEDIFEFDECHHVYCRVCLTQYFEHHIGEGAVLDLCCPSPNCTTEVTIEDIRFLCDYDTVGKYERFVVIASLKADANTRWCPGPGCVNGVKYDNQQWLHCNLCNLDFCSMCLLNKHEGSECSKAALAALAARQAEEEKALEQFKKWAESQNSRIKPCPRCHSFIEKTEGCNHMTCANISCRHQFCWLCLGDYDDGRHFNDFTNYPNCYDKQFFYTNNYDVPDFAHNPIARRRFGRIAKKIGIYVGVGMAVVTLGVPAAVIGGPVYGCFQLHKRLKAKRAAKARRDTYYNPDFVPPSPERIAAARREVERLRALEQGLNLGRY